MKRRDANRLLVGLAALGGAVVGFSFPLDLMERAFAASGVADALPPLAPPQGLSARLVLIVAFATLAAGLVAVILPWKRPRAQDRPVAQPYFSTMATPDDTVPVLRRSDAHPDAPPRAPLFASRDLGHEALPPVDRDDGDLTAMFDRIWPDEEARVVGEDLPPPPLEPLPWETIQAEMDRLLAGVRFRPLDDEATLPAAPADAVDPASAASRDGAGGHVPSINELIARLENGLARRRAQPANGSVCGAAPVETSVAPSRPCATADADITLRVG